MLLYAYHVGSFQFFKLVKVLNSKRVCIFIYTDASSKVALSYFLLQNHHTELQMGVKPVSTVNNIGQLPCASASVSRCTASVLVSVRAAAGTQVLHYLGNFLLPCR